MIPVGYHLKFNNFDSDSYRFPVSIPMWLKKKVKHLDIKHIYSGSPFTKHLIAAEYHFFLMEVVVLLQFWRKSIRTKQNGIYE